MKWFKVHKSTIKWSIFFLKIILLIPAIYSLIFLLILQVTFGEIFLIIATYAISLAVSFVDCLEKSFYQKINDYLSVFLLDVIFLFISLITIARVPILFFFFG